MCLDDEEKHVLALFRTNWAHRLKIALYGEGRHTKNIIKYFPSSDIVGIMSAEQKTGKKWGKSYLSPEDILDIHPTIVVVARDAVLSIIIRRLAKLASSGIQIFTLSGRNLTISPMSDEYAGTYKISEQTVRNIIEKYEYISFDFFDTLVTRKVLRPQQVFFSIKNVLQRQRWRENDAFFVKNFVEFRTKFLSASYVIFSLEELYEKIQHEFRISDYCRKFCYNTEMAVEEKLILPRYDMISLFSSISTLKKCFIISDTNFSSKNIKQLCDKFGLCVNSGKIITSSEARFSKENGRLYDFYLQKIGSNGSNCIHIGDNRIADIKNAKLRNIDAIQIYSPEEMLLYSTFQILLDEETTPDKNKTVGMFASYFFNSPYSESTPLSVKVSSLYQIGKYFIAPLVLNWFFWFKEIVSKRKISHIFYSSRDGYIFYKVHLLLQRKGFPLPSASYIRVSRKLCYLSSLQSESDIVDSAPKSFPGTLKDYFFSRFGILIEDERPYSLKNFILLSKKYSATILKKSYEYRKEYVNYLETFDDLKKDSGCRAFFDFVASGTVQYYLEKITGKEFIGCYFAKGNGLFSLDVESPFLFNNYSNDYFLQSYILLECIFTDPYSTVEGFKEGKPIFREPGVNNKFYFIVPLREG